ncbi:bifunctional 3-phenylpropionate/cinnamic acid dioxygenase ferredoxin subunit [bacterium]|nr:MAG: bifunctional 3-phenylpropionate/cinnamic acid dioxygenase ferredoxin subunit [bacterium]
METKLIRVCSVSDVSPGSGKAFLIGSYKLAVYNVQGEFYASADTCSHAEESLAEGWLEGTNIECPRHGAQFCLKTGEAKTLPATEPIEVFETEVRDGDLYVKLPAKYL